MSARIDTAGLSPGLARLARFIVRTQPWYAFARWNVGSAALFDVVGGAVWGPWWCAAAGGIAGPVGIWLLLKMQRGAAELEQLLTPGSGCE